jgi:CRISPR-associated protein Cas2
MAKNAHFVVIAYDIPDDRRRKRVMDTLIDHGCIRVNYSVFEGLIKKSRYIKMKASIKNIIDKKEDNVRYYIICESCISFIEIQGLEVASCADKCGNIII